MGEQKRPEKSTPETRRAGPTKSLAVVQNHQQKQQQQLMESLIVHRVGDVNISTISTPNEAGKTGTFLQSSATELNLPANTCSIILDVTDYYSVQQDEVMERSEMSFFRSPSVSLSNSNWVIICLNLHTITLNDFWSVFKKSQLYSKTNVKNYNLLINR